MTLKTLGDIQTCIWTSFDKKKWKGKLEPELSGTILVNYDELRAEAIKCFKAISTGELKEISEGKHINMAGDIIAAPDKLVLSASDAHAICCFIRWFNNLTEDDLK